MLDLLLDGDKYRKYQSLFLQTKQKNKSLTNQVKSLTEKVQKLELELEKLKTETTKAKTTTRKRDSKRKQPVAKKENEKVDVSEKQEHVDDGNTNSNT